MEEMDFLEPPSLAHGPAEAPLIAYLRTPAHGADALRVRVAQRGLVWTLVFPGPTAGKTLLILGLMPHGEATLTVQLVGETGAKSWKHALSLTPRDIPESPLEMPPLQTHVSRPERMAGQFTFLTIRRRATGRIVDMTPAQRKFLTGWGMLLAIDNAGRMRWMRKLPARAAGIERLDSGNLFVHDTNFCSREIDMAGKTVDAWVAADRPQGPEEGAVPVPVQSLHHQPHQMPNGNFLAVSGHARLVRDWPASVHEPGKHRADKHVVGDKVIEFTREGEIVWEWDSFDHLDPYRIGYDALDAYWHVRGFPDHGDWTHCNGVCYDPADNSVILSLRLQDCVIKIDRRSGEIKWILGDHEGWGAEHQSKLLTPIGEGFRWPWHGHNPRITSEGTIVMFDNAIYMARPGSPRVPFHRSLSRGVEYRVNENDRTVEQVWTSALTDADVKERTWAMGDAHRFEETDTAMVIHSIAMPHGRDDIGMDEEDRSMRYVAEFPSYARILEYNRRDRNDILFDMTVRDKNEIIQWEVFSGVRVDSLYPDHMNVRWIEGDALLPATASQ